MLSGVKSSTGKQNVSCSSIIIAAVFVCRPEDDDFDMEEEMRKLQPQRLPRQPQFEPRSRRGLVEDPRVSVIPEAGGPGTARRSLTLTAPSCTETTTKMTTMRKALQLLQKHLQHHGQLKLTAAVGREALGGNF
ncbi:hypothetical protein INR49_023868 [Caranx melampygus]|nr:hypothetical protein INR49_023868 [Caranx melampygus]